MLWIEQHIVERYVVFLDEEGGGVLTSISLVLSTIGVSCTISGKVMLAEDSSGNGAIVVLCSGITNKERAFAEN